ncbi:unnamed protein product, partial [Polarella glacialis]
MAVPEAVTTSAAKAPDASQTSQNGSDANLLSPIKKKVLEVHSDDAEANLENKIPDDNADANTKNISTPEDSKTKVPRPYLEIETGDEEETQSPGYEDRKISLDLTPLSCKSTDSSAEYHEPNQTIIILDWDDTICPSTTCMRQHGLSVLGAPPTGAVAEALEELAKEARLLI